MNTILLVIGGGIALYLGWTFFLSPDAKVNRAGGQFIADNLTGASQTKQVNDLGNMLNTASSEYKNNPAYKRNVDIRLANSKDLTPAQKTAFKQTLTKSMYGAGKIAY